MISNIYTLRTDVVDYEHNKKNSPTEISRANAQDTSIRGSPTDTNLMILSRGSSNSR